MHTIIRQELLFTSDAGHGWLRVPHELVTGIYKPSQYSYKDSSYYYLEEDCDAMAWENKMRAQVIADFESLFYFKFKNINGLSSIRQKERAT